MEVIYHEKTGQGKITLPKNIRQIGTEQGNYRVYIEDYAYSFIKDIVVDEDDDGAVGILLGETREADGITYAFIKGVVEVTNAAVFTDKIAFTDETWPITKKYINQYFGDYDILGWYLSSSKITDKNMDIINKADKESFKEPAKVFFMVNASNGDEIFYEKSENGLVPLKGYTVYFEKNLSMQKYMKEMQSEYEEKYSQKEIPKEANHEENPTKGQYRELVKDNEGNNGKTIKRNLTFIYALSMLVIIVALVIGINAINSSDKMSSLGGSATKEANATPQNENQSKTPVTTLEGNVTEEVTTQEAATQESVTQEPTTQEPTTAAETYETYVVQQGDSMWGLCEKFYGKYSEEAVNKILSVNGMSSLNDFQAGITIKIPSMD